MRRLAIVITASIGAWAGSSAFAQSSAGHTELAPGAPTAPAAPAAGAQPTTAARPVFDFDEIQRTPLDMVVTKTVEKDGVIIEWLEFTSRVVDGKPERIKGIMAYPAKGLKKPAVFWSQGGMAPAGEYFPLIFAKKGYACLNITLDHKMRNSWDAFDTSKPDQANLTLLARDQMRGITLLAGRPEVDSDRISVGGASYGGFYATLIAGVDPRVKAGFSFFAGGHHPMGTNLPQFTKMKTVQDAQVWMQTIDPAPGHARRNVPFFWGVAFDDHWFLLPALAETYRNAKSPDKRVLIAGDWKHGFSEAIDQQLCDFLDTVILENTPRFNQPGELKTTVDTQGRLVASFPWTGPNPVKRAEVLLSPGLTDNWVGWSLRASTTVPATIQGNTATAVIPVGSAASDMLLVGQVYDDKGRQTSTLPLILKPSQLSAAKADPAWTFNCFPANDFSAGSAEFFERLGYPVPGKDDPAFSPRGVATRRMEPPAKVTAAWPGHKMPFIYHVPGAAHKLTLRLRADKESKVQVRVKPLDPANFQSEIVRALVAQQPGGKQVIERYKPGLPELVFEASADGQFKEFTFDVPAPAGPIEGYDIFLKPIGDAPATLWVDQLKFEPVW